MSPFLEIHSGPSRGKKVSLAVGQPVTVGRREGATLVVRDDPMLSNAHFALEWDGTTCRLRDLNSRFGTFLNGAKVVEAEVRDGDRIVAGQTTFVLGGAAERPPARESAPVAARETTPAGKPEPSPPAAKAVAVPGEGLDTIVRLLQGQSEPVFALLDSARDPRVLEFLRNSPLLHQSLYEGPKGDELKEFAPYLVQLPPQSPALAPLVRESWGKSWGVYLTCEQPFKEVRKHFRRFLLVKTEAGEEVYFRFYDPRVLRVFLPTCTAQELAEFFGPVSSYLLEPGELPALVQFTRDAQGLRQRLLTPAAPVPVGTRTPAPPVPRRDLQGRS